MHYLQSWTTIILFLWIGIKIDECKGAPSEIIPKRIFLNKGQAKVAGAASKSSISYHGGPVMLGTINVYYIWYGNWSGNTASTILTKFMTDLGNSSWWNITTKYYDGNKNYVGSPVYNISLMVSSYLGNSLSDTQIKQIVSDAITSSQLPGDTNGVYFVLTSADITASSGFCTNYCGWHTHATINGKDIKYSFIGNPDRCPSACEAQQTTSPNDNPGADGMASIIAHELTETATDPDLNAWYDSAGYENADKCAWTFGTQQTATNGAKYNVQIGGKQYLIQQNFMPTQGPCTLS